MSGGVLGAALGLGVVLVATRWRATRRPSVDQRVAPYVRDVVPSLPPWEGGSGWASAVWASVLAALVEAMSRALGGSPSVVNRLERLGLTTTLDEFIVRQVMWGAGAFVCSAAASLWWWAGHGGAALGYLVACLVAFVAGMLWCDRRLSAAVESRERALAEEFPVVAEMLALSVAAGEGPVAGLERVVTRCHGVIGDELGRVLADIRTGRPVPEAFDALSSRTGVPSMARFAEALAVAVERGTPLTDVLHAQAADVRESARRDLIEAGGQREVAMMIPVVFLILPVTIIFAFFPGYVGLQLSSG